MFTHMYIHLICHPCAEDVLTARPPWKDPDAVPEDLERAFRALCNDVNPNDPSVPKALLLHHTKFGQPKKSSMSQSARGFGLEKTDRKTGHRALTVAQQFYSIYMYYMHYMLFSLSDKLVYMSRCLINKYMCINMPDVW